MPRRRSPIPTTQLDPIAEFLRTGDSILSRRVVKSGLRNTLSLKFERGHVLSVHAEGPDEEDLRSFWVDMRRLLAPGAPSHFPRVMNVARQRFGEAGPAERFESLREAWNASLAAGPIAFSVNEERLSPATLLDLWLNGVVFHDDHVKRERWAEVAAPFTEVPQMIIHRTTVRLLEICMAAMARLDYLQGGPGIVSIVEGRKVS